MMARCLDSGVVKMAGAFATALLDELMGRNRDEHPDGQRKTHWSDPEVIYFNVQIYLCCVQPAVC